MRVGQIMGKMRIHQLINALKPLLLVAPLALVACARTIATDEIEQSIQSDVEKQGGVSVAEMVCPPKLRPEIGQTFECTGELESGSRFYVVVKQLDDKGTVNWDIPHSRGLLNVSKLETYFQETVTQNVGVKPQITCGSVYRPNKPGDSFECRVVNPTPKPTATKSGTPKQAAATTQSNPPGKNSKNNKSKPKPFIESILVKVDSDGNVNWQPVEQAPVAATTAKAPATKTAQAASTADAPATVPEAKKSPAPPAKSSAEDFLNQPGAFDDF
jgi:hypothetical protein